MFDIEWVKAEKREDPNFEGSLFQRLGFCKLLCPTCGSHLSEGNDERGHYVICLNGCHLSSVVRSHFEELFQKLPKKGGEAIVRDPDFPSQKEGTSKEIR